MRRKRFAVLLTAIVFVACSCDFIENVNPFSSDSSDSLEIYRERLDSINLAREREREEMLERERVLLEKIDKLQSEAEKTRITENYHLIVGAFRTPAYAQNYKEKFSSGGYDSRIITAPNGFHLVTIGSYESYRNAVNEYHRIRSAGEYEVWLYSEAF